MKTHRKTRIVLARETDEEDIIRLLSLLREGFEVKKFYSIVDRRNPPLLIIRMINLIKKWNRTVKNFKPDKVVIYGEEVISIWIIVLLIRVFQLKIEIIVFKYDIECFRPYSRGFNTTVGHFIARIIEKFCFINSDKILHKGLENELKFLPFYNKIKMKKHYLFREFLKSDVIGKYNPNKLSKKDGDFHLVYVGGIHLESLPYEDSIWEFYPKLTDQKIHLHIYSYPTIDKNTIKKFKELELTNPYLHFEGHRNHKILIKEISKYDYGITLHGYNRTGIKNDYYSMTAIGNKYFDYMSAKLPILVVNEYLPVVHMIDKFGIGFYLEQKKLKYLNKMLINHKKKYSTMVRNIEKAIPELLDHKKLLEFIES